MKESWKKGLIFGLTSGIITTLGMIVGLHSSTGSQIVIIGGILAIAVADAFSDALGIHISEEAENKHSHNEIWEATIGTFASKFFFACTFIVPIWFLPLETAIIVSIVYGLFMIGISNYVMARAHNEKPVRIVSEHMAIAIAVIIITHFVGEFVATLG